MATTFGNEWFPLVRFEIGDVGRVAVAPCPCGRSEGLTLSAIEGRLTSLCVAADGTLVTHGCIDGVLSEVPGLREYRLDQPSPHRVICKIMADPGSSITTARGVRESLETIFGPRMDIQVEEAPVLMPEKSGKFLLARRSFPLQEALRG